MGVKFESSTAGYISGILFYKGTSNTGTHVGDLWSSTGTLLASATFSSETASGWQQVNFATPVAISANTVYVASYFSPTGIVAYSNNFFASAVTNPPLTAPASSSVGGNGVYVYASSPKTFPNSTYQASNYWVDVVFSNPTPTVTSTTPANGATGVSFTAPNITATFNEAVQSSTISFSLKDANQNTIATNFSYNTATNTATWTPTAALAPSTTYTATASGAQDVPSLAMSPYSWSFTTAAASTPTKLVIQTQPSATGTAGVAFATQPVIYEEDQNGNLETGDNSTVVTVALASGAGPLQGTLTATVVGGIATFTNLADNTAETITLKFTSPNLTSATSGNIAISPAAANKLAIQTQPSSTATAGVPFATQPAIYEEDQYGNVETGDNSTVVTAALASWHRSAPGHADSHGRRRDRDVHQPRR